MPIIPWDKSFETGVPLLDETRKRFLLKANLFCLKCKIYCAPLECEEGLSSLETLLLSYFSKEEALQKEYEYPYFHHHQATHDHLRARMREIGFLLRSNAFSESSLQEFYHFLSDVFCEHLRFDDIKFAKYLRKNQ